jgi:zinc transport system ATP-binding protein
MPLIKCDDLTLSYEGHTVLTELTFDINAGDYLCVVGENGSGKSTLIKALLGLKAPKSGAIIFGDGLKQTEIGYLPQQTGIQRDFPATVWEVVLSGCLNLCGRRPFFTKREKERAIESLRRLDIFDIKSACYHDLSGGQQQRVLLARALCATRKLILLDEPVTGLDPVATGELYAIIRDLNKSDGITVIMVSHDIRAAIDNADKILHLHNTPLFFGSTEDYLKTDIGRKFTGGGENG